MQEPHAKRPHQVYGLQDVAVEYSGKQYNLRWQKNRSSCVASAVLCEWSECILKFGHREDNVIARDTSLIKVNRKDLANHFTCCSQLLFI